MMVDLYRARNLAPEGMLRSIQRWIANGVIPFRMTGNKPLSGLSGKYLLLLFIFKLIWPQSNYCECITFIANESNDGPNGLIGSVSNPRIWAHVTNEPGTSAEAYRIFVEHVLGTYNAIENPALRRTLIHNNLTSNRAPEVYKAVRQRGHRVVCRPRTDHRMGPSSTQ